MKRNFAAVILILLILFAAGCAKTAEEETGISIYYMDKQETELVKTDYPKKRGNREEILNYLLDGLMKEPEETGLKRAVPEQIKLLYYKLEGEVVTLNFSLDYMDMEKNTEVLCRAGIVKTLGQVKGVTSVTILVNDTPLTDSDGNPYGLMKPEDFVVNTGEDINSVQTATLKLYYANKAGTGLKMENVTVHYNNNLSMERLVLEQLIAGPVTEKDYPVLPAETKILGVSTKDGMCYVNFDESVLSQGVNVREDVQIYAIVNSLAEITNVNQVQISINGESNRVFKESIRLDSIFERNLDLKIQED